MFYVLLYYYQINKFDTINYFTYADSTLYVILFIFIFYLNFIYNPKSEKVGTVWKTQIKKESSDF